MHKGSGKYYFPEINMPGKYQKSLLKCQMFANYRALYSQICNEVTEHMLRVQINRLCKINRICKVDHNVMFKQLTQIKCIGTSTRGVERKRAVSNHNTRSTHRIQIDRNKLCIRMVTKLKAYFRNIKRNYAYWIDISRIGNHNLYASARKRKLRKYCYWMKEESMTRTPSLLDALQSSKLLCTQTILFISFIY